MNQFSGLECEICHRVFEDGEDIVVCPICGTPYHKDCYKTTGKCIHEDKHGSYEFENPNKKLKINNDNKEEDKTQKHNENQDKQCPNCGSVIDVKEKVCSECGVPVNLSTLIQMTVNNPMGNNINEKIFGIDIKDWISFLGVNAISFLIKFKRLEQKGPFSFTFNIGAAIFRGGYFLYRKMYMLGSLLILLDLAIYLWVFRIFSPIINKMMETLPTQNFQLTQQMVKNMVKSPEFESILMQNSSKISLIFCILGLIFGSTVTLMYKNFCVRKIKSIRAKNFRNDLEYRKELAKKGSVNYAVAFIGMTLLFLMSFPKY